MTKMAERQRTVLALRAEGMGYPAIAEHLGISSAYAYQLGSDDPTAAKRKDRYRRPCVRCGRLTNPGGVKPRNGQGPRTGLCGQCAKADAGDRMREAGAFIRETIRGMWNDGLTTVEIADAIGWTPKSVGSYISQQRAKGHEFVYRRPDMIEHAPGLAARRSRPIVVHGHAESVARRVEQAKRDGTFREATSRCGPFSVTGEGENERTECLKCDAVSYPPMEDE